MFKSNLGEERAGGARPSARRGDARRRVNVCVCRVRQTVYCDLRGAGRMYSGGQFKVITIVYAAGGRCRGSEGDAEGG